MDKMRYLKLYESFNRDMFETIEDIFSYVRDEEMEVNVEYKPACRFRGEVETGDFYKIEIYKSVISQTDDYGYETTYYEPFINSKIIDECIKELKSQVGDNIEILHYDNHGRYLRTWKTNSGELKNPENVGLITIDIKIGDGKKAREYFDL
jgi:hypothetical protein